MFYSIFTLFYQKKVFGKSANFVNIYFLPIQQSFAVDIMLMYKCNLIVCLGLGNIKCIVQSTNFCQVQLSASGHVRMEFSPRALP